MTLFDVFSVMPESARLKFSSESFREKKRRAYERIATRASAIITLSEATRREIVRRLAPRCKVHVIPPGIIAPPVLSLEEARRELAPHRIEPPFVLTVGALCPRKNIEAGVRAVLAVRRVRPELKLVLVGEPSFGWHGSAGELAVRNAGEAVIVAGYLPARVLRAAYKMSEALLHLSHHEGYGLTVLEALASGTEVLASDRGGIPEAAGGAAWLVDPDDPDAAPHVLEAILAGTSDKEVRRHRGLEHVRNLGWGTAAERVEQLYQEILGS